MYRRLRTSMMLVAANTYTQYSPRKTARFAMIFPRSGLPGSLIDHAHDDQCCEESRNHDRGNEPRCRSSRALVARLAGHGLGSPTLVIAARDRSRVIAGICLTVIREVILGMYGAALVYQL